LMVRRRREFELTVALLDELTAVAGRRRGASRCTLL
jgi:hypothetical protein